MVSGAPLLWGARCLRVALMAPQSAVATRQARGSIWVAAGIRHGHMGHRQKLQAGADARRKCLRRTWRWNGAAPCCTV
jgi:hypothetical protein